MLRYDTVVDGVWHGYAMVVIADEGSDYSRTPWLTLRYGSAKHTHGNGGIETGMAQTTISGEPSQDRSFDVDAVVIWQYHAVSGPNTFFRFKLEIPLAEYEMPVHYSVNGGNELQFWVPGRSQNMRWMGHVRVGLLVELTATLLSAGVAVVLTKHADAQSCNGFSGGVDTDAFNGPSPLWDDFLKLHKEKPFHAVIGGGDQCVELVETTADKAESTAT